MIAQWFPVRLDQSGAIVERWRPRASIRDAANDAHERWQSWIDAGRPGPAHESQPFAVVFGAARAVTVDLHVVTFAPGRFGPSQPECVRAYWPGSDQ